MMDIPSRWIIIAGVVLVIFGIIAIIGGYYAIKRRNWGLALTGSILSLPGSGVLGTLAIIFMSLGKREFE